METRDIRFIVPSPLKTVLADQPATTVSACTVKIQPKYAYDDSHNCPSSLYSMLMTEDESDDCNLLPSLTVASSSDDGDKLNTVLEERSHFLYELHSSTSDASTLSSVKLPPTRRQIQVPYELYKLLTYAL